MPPANMWRPCCRYWAKLEGISFPGHTEELAPTGESVASKDRVARGSIRAQIFGIWPNNGFTSGSLFCLDAGGLGGEGFSVEAMDLSYIGDGQSAAGRLDLGGALVS
jgi:hypothetical protein